MKNIIKINLVIKILIFSSYQSEGNPIYTTFTIGSILDVSFNEDNFRLYSQKVQDNMNVFMKCSINIHKQYLGENKKQLSNMLKFL